MEQPKTVENPLLSELTHISERYNQIKRIIAPIGDFFKWQGKYSHGIFVKESLVWYIKEEQIVIEFEISDSMDDTREEINLLVPYHIILKAKTIESLEPLIVLYAKFYAEKRDQINLIKCKMVPIQDRINIFESTIHKKRIDFEEQLKDTRYTIQYKDFITKDLKALEQEPVYIIDQRKELKELSQAINRIETEFNAMVEKIE